MRSPISWRSLLLVVLGGVLFFGLNGQRPAHAGGPLIVGGSFGVDAQPFTWDTSAPIDYTTDAGMLGTLSETEANDRVAMMFQVWADVSTATISFSRAGPIMNAGVFTDGDVNTMEEFNAVEGSCNNGTQSPIVYDVDGSMFDDLVGDPNVIGFAGPCRLDDVGRILSAEAALNGRFLDGVDTPTNSELNPDEFDAAFIHEFGHFSGLDHSQVNLNPCFFLLPTPCSADDIQGLPTMFPILLPLQGASGENFGKTLAIDDTAWISRLYPNQDGGPDDFNTKFGKITGNILFSDGATLVQGANVIARMEDDLTTTGVDESRAVASSNVSGYLFTGNPGQSVTGTNPGSSFGSRDPSLRGFFELVVPPGTYRLEVESVDLSFEGGSGLNPLNPPNLYPRGCLSFWVGHCWAW